MFVIYSFGWLEDAASFVLKLQLLDQFFSAYVSRRIIDIRRTFNADCAENAAGKGSDVTKVD